MHHLQFLKELLEAVEASNVSTSILLELVNLSQQPQRFNQGIYFAAPVLLICFCVVGLLCMVIMSLSFRTMLRQLVDLVFKQPSPIRPKGEVLPEDTQGRGSSRSMSSQSAPRSEIEMAVIRGEVAHKPTEL